MSGYIQSIPRIGCEPWDRLGIYKDICRTRYSQSKSHMLTFNSTMSPLNFLGRALWIFGILGGV